MADARRAAKGRCDRFLQVLSLSQLEATEKFMREQVVASGVTVPKMTNPTGDKSARPCATCSRARPPADGAEPWQCEERHGQLCGRGLRFALFFLFGFEHDVHCLQECTQILMLRIFSL